MHRGAVKRAACALCARLVGQSTLYPMHEMKPETTLVGTKPTMIESRAVPRKRKTPPVSSVAAHVATSTVGTAWAACAGAHPSKPSGHSCFEMIAAASARNTAGLMSGPATTARQDEAYAKTKAPSVTVSVCDATPMGTAGSSSAFCPKIISAKTEQKA